MKKPIRTALKTTLKFELVPVADPNWDQYWPTQEWVAADEKYAFRIMRLRNMHFEPVFLAYASRLDGSKQNQIGPDFKPSRLLFAIVRISPANFAVRLPITRPAMRLLAGCSAFPGFGSR
jgi:hypothetical protein